MIRATVKGDWGKTERLLKAVGRKNHSAILNKYGEIGVAALAKATPVLTGKTAASWRYEVHVDRSESRLEFHNDNVNDGVNIALILNYGHATQSGVWVEGRNYIGPTLEEVFNKLADEIWKEVKKS